MTKLTYNNIPLIEGRDMNVQEDEGFEQSFVWFCEEVGFLALEYGARERAFGVRMGWVGDACEGVSDEVGGRKSMVVKLRVRKEMLVKLEVRKETLGRIGKGMGRKERRSLKLKIRLRGTERGRATAFRVS